MKKTTCILSLLISVLFLNSCVFSVLPSITFYGRVIDQNERPVTNAKVIYSGSSTYLSEGGGRGSVITDESGYFEIDTTGATLKLGSILHPDIEYSYQQDTVSRRINQSLDRLKSTKRFLSSKDNAGIYDNWKRYTKKENAYIIHAWRLGEYDGAIKGAVSAYTDLDGKEYTVDFLGHNYKTKIKEGLQEGHLIVSCIRKPMENANDYGDWSVTIAPVNGAIQSTSDVYMNEAPESDYQSSITIDMKYNTAEFQPYLLNQRYYFTANNGKSFGSLYARFEPHRRHDRNRCSIEFNQFKLNSTGSRNLELK